VDSDAMALLFLKSIPVHATGGKSWRENGRRGWR
jgi:hypothetical protein